MPENPKTMTPSKDPVSSKARISEILKSPENSNPNTFSGRTPLPKTPKLKNSAPKTPARGRSQLTEFGRGSENNPNLSGRSPAVKSSKIGSMKPRNANLRNPICKGRKLMSGKKSPRKETAVQDLGTTQDKVFLSNGLRSQVDGSNTKDEVIPTVQPFSERIIIEEDTRPLTVKLETQDTGGFDSPHEMSASKMKKKYNRVLETARCSVPEPGRVMNLIKAFEGILSIPSSESSEEKEGEEYKNRVKWAWPALRVNVEESEICSSSFSSSDLFPSRSSGSDSGISSSFDSSNERLSLGSRTSGKDRRSRRNSFESSGRTDGRKMDKQLKVTCQQPFKLRTEQRGKSKKEEFHKKLEEMIMEEQKQRIPIAQGLPWTTDEPEHLVKPTVKESTQPLELKLHSDLRAVERAEFDHVIAGKISLMEQYRMEREKQQKWEEEEELKRLRKALVPRAQPMPFFDRPFIPKRSLKYPTVPREPKFHNSPQKNIDTEGIYAMEPTWLAVDKP